MDNLLKECLEVAGWNINYLEWLIVKHPNVWLKAVNKFQGTLSLKQTIDYFEIEVAGVLARTN